MDDIHFKIAEAARMAGVSPSTLRLWETQDLIQPIRTPSGQRLYDRALVERLKTVAWLRSEKGVEVLEFAAGYALFEVDTPETAQRVLKQALATSPVQRFAPSQPSLATIFKEVIK